jgi:hypothetical protein
MLSEVELFRLKVVMFMIFKPHNHKFYQKNNWCCKSIVSLEILKIAMKSQHAVL